MASIIEQITKEEAMELEESHGLTSHIAIGQNSGTTAIYLQLDDGSETIAEGKATLNFDSTIVRGEWINVEEEYQERGIGRDMIGLLERIGRALGMQEVLLYKPEPQLEEFYIALGYRPTEDPEFFIKCL